ncbi:MAG: hypothetical protein ACT4N2_13025 [Hyphomicrobium sp.]
MIEEQALISAIMETRQQIDFLWQFFVTVHIAIFALLFIYDHAVENLNILARAFAVAGVALFEWINGNALANTYRLLDAMLDQYRHLYGDVTRFRPSFYAEFVMARFSDRPDLVKITHGMAFAVVILAFVSKSFIQARRRAPLA